MDRNKIILFLFIVALAYLPATEVSFDKIPELVANNSSEWASIDINTQKAASGVARSKWNFRPDFSILPKYSYYDDMQNEGIQSYGLTLGMDWLLPTDGILSATLSDEVGVKDKQGWPKSSPQLSLNYSQPVGVNGHFLNPSLYKKNKQFSVVIPSEKKYWQALLDRNNFLFQVASSFVAFDSVYRQEVVKQLEIELKQREFDFATQLKEQGGVSGNDYWSKQMEVTQLEDLLLEISYQREEAEKGFLNLLGVDKATISHAKPDYSLFDIEKEKIPSIIEENNPEVRLLSYTNKQNEYLAALKQKPKAGSLDLNFKWACPTASESTPPFGNLFEIDGRPSFTISYKTSMRSQIQGYSQRKSNELSEDQNKLNYDTVVRQKEVQLTQLLNKRKMLISKVNHIEENIEFLLKQIEREEQLFKIQSTTPLSVDWAKWNYISRRTDFDSAVWELILNRLEIGCICGEDLTTLF